MTSKLKPCPFCGGKAHSTKEIRSANLAAVVMCSENDCCSNRAETLQQAADLWNARATPSADPLAGLVRYGLTDYAVMQQRKNGEYVLHSDVMTLISRTNGDHTENSGKSFAFLDPNGGTNCGEAPVSDSLKVENEIFRTALEEIAQEFTLTTSRMRLRNIAVAALDSTKNRKLPKC